MTVTSAAPARTCLTVVLAAGGGTRMRSRLPKVLHSIGGATLLHHVLTAAGGAGTDAIAVVVGPDHCAVRDEVERASPGAEVFIQSERRGTAHAVLAARAALGRGFDDVLVVFGDTPLIRPDSLAMLRMALATGATVAVLGFEAQDPTGYGRLISVGNELVAIREHKDASEAELQIRRCNAGLMALDGSVALEILSGIGDRNAQGEFYLTDAVDVARSQGGRATALMAEETEVMGVNDRLQLAAAEQMLQRRLREAAMRGGATLTAPETVFFSFDTRLGCDVIVEPHVVFGPGVSVAEGAIIHAFSHLERATVQEGASVGPYARLRPGSVIGRNAKVGNFVELKQAELGAGAKVNHLSYIGDAHVGESANIGAGTITCNYDGTAKHRTEIGAGAFVGSNSALVAPVAIGAGAYVGSGSVITEDVEADALAIGRGRQTVKQGWAAAFRRAAQRQKQKA